MIISGKYGNVTRNFNVLEDFKILTRFFPFAINFIRYTCKKSFDVTEFHINLKYLSCSGLWQK